MIYEEIMYGVKCDRCHELYEDADGYTLHSDKHDAESYAEDAEWHKDGNKHYCPRCYTIDENDNVVVKPMIHHSFFDFWRRLKMLTGYVFSFSESDTHYMLTYRYVYKRIDDARLSILKETLEDFEMEYKTPDKMNGTPREILTISIPKDFKPYSASRTGIKLQLKTESK